jgi:hypothetical protein
MRLGRRASLRLQLWLRVAREAAFRTFLAPAAQGHQSMAIWAHATANQEVALDVPLFVARLSSQDFNPVRVCVFNHGVPFRAKDAQLVARTEPQRRARLWCFSIPARRCGRFSFAVRPIVCGMVEHMASVAQAALVPATRAAGIQLKTIGTCHCVSARCELHPILHRPSQALLQSHADRLRLSTPSGGQPSGYVASYSFLP